MPFVKTYKDLTVWQESYELAKEIYLLTKHFPSDEQFGLTSQMRRAGYSIPSNIAEGFRRRYTNERKRFFQIAFGSSSELETQLLLAKDLHLAPSELFPKIEKRLDGVSRPLNRLCESLR